MGYDDEAHRGVGQATELGAKPLVDAGLIDIDLEGVDPAGYQIHLAVDLGNPDAVNHIGGGEA